MIFFQLYCYNKIKRYSLTSHKQISYARCLLSVHFMVHANQFYILDVMIASLCKEKKNILMVIIIYMALYHMVCRSYFFGGEVSQTLKFYISRNHVCFSQCHYLEALNHSGFIYIEFLKLITIIHLCTPRVYIFFFPRKTLLFIG